MKEASHRLVFNIQHCSMHDGPGIRTVIFFKGCPLRCPWCSNPESQHWGQELAFKPALCLGAELCNRCEQACTHGGLRHDGTGGKIFARAQCQLCGHCVKACPSRALSLFGQAHTVEDLLHKGERDRDFYATSGGGITLSGGEPLWRAETPALLLAEAKRRGLHTCVETCGFYDAEQESTREALHNLDYMIFDIKHINSEIHKKTVGVPLEPIVENLRRLGDDFPHLPVAVRTPVIGGFNDSEEVIGGIAALLAGMPHVRQYELLPYHAFGAVKYAQLGRPYTMNEGARVDEERMRLLCAAAAAHVPCMTH